LSSTAQPSPPAQMLGMLNGFLTVQARHVAAVPGIADRRCAGSWRGVVALGYGPDGMRIGRKVRG